MTPQYELPLRDSLRWLRFTRETPRAMIAAIASATPMTPAIGMALPF